MIIVKLMGGLGNQMFQFAFGKYLSLKHNNELALDLSAFKNIRENDGFTIRTFGLDAFNVSYAIASSKEIEKCYLHFKNKRHRIIGSIYRKIYSYSILTEDNYDPLQNNYRNNLYLIGYWQSEKYFKEIKEVLLSEFTLKNHMEPYPLSILSKITNCESVSIHIRRGDYITNKAAFDILGPCSLEYYYNSVKYIAERIVNPIFYVFSDDINWVKDNFRIDYPFEIVDNIGPEIEMSLMMVCKHNIISNSSFSWWGAWLNTNKSNITICPKNWFKIKPVTKYEITPDNWIKLN
jgi:hypothetical protein